MPFFKEININEHTTAYFWKISEDIDEARSKIDGLLMEVKR